MHLLVTDHVTCPRCGPDAGLILLADRMEGRRILEGWLGCPTCRQKYRVRGGLAELFSEETLAGRPDIAEPEALTVAGLLGVAEGPGLLLLVGEMAAAAEALAQLINNVEVIVATPYPNERAEHAGVSRMQVGAVLPLRDGSMRGVAVAGSGLQLLEEAARVCALAARVVVFGAGAATRGVAERSGLHVLAEEGNTMLAVRRE